jgi:ribulose-phosphate 3-epimerase
MCDFGNLQREVERLEEAGVQALHLDVMDGHFVPNLTYGMPIVEGLRRLTDLPLDVHLMIQSPDDYVTRFVESGACMLTVHVEACDNPRATLKRIQDHGVVAGIALNPQTPLARIEPFLDACDLVLVMSVEAGFGGQSFQRSSLEKLKHLRDTMGDAVLLEVDGGINRATIADCTEAGAELLVVGSAIFKNSDYGLAVRQLLESATGSI